MLKRHTQTPLYQGNTKMLPLGTSPAHRLDWEVYVKSLIVDPSTPPCNTGVKGKPVNYNQLGRYSPSPEPSAHDFK